MLSIPRPGPKYNPRKYFRFPSILLRIQLGNSLCPRASCPDLLELCWNEGGGGKGARGVPHTLLPCSFAGAEFPAPWICVSGCDGGGGGRISLCLAAWRALLRSTLRVRCYDSYYHNKCLSAEEGAYSSVRHNYHPRFTRLKTYVKI